MAFCVYKHTSPDGRIYIGMTGQRPQARWQGGNGYKGNTYFTRAIRKYGWENFKHEIIADQLPKIVAQTLEILLIDAFKSNQRKYGFNISTGGESKSGTKISDWHKQRISEASKGRTVSKETREKLSKASKSTWSNQKHIEHMREINKGSNNKMYGHVMTDDEKIQRGAKCVIQKDKQGNIVATYISIHQASEKTGIGRGGISDCCRHKLKTSGGYIWELDNK